jgi:hypothetical protein
MRYMSVTATSVDKAMVTNEPRTSHLYAFVGSVFLFKSSDMTLKEPMIVIDNLTQKSTF